MYKGNVQPVCSYVEKDKQGNIRQVTTRPEEVKRKVSCHFKNIFGQRARGLQLEEILRNVDTIITSEDEDKLFSLLDPDEISKALRNMQISKAAGDDGIEVAYLKWGGDSVQDWLFRVINDTLQERKT